VIGYDRSDRYVRYSMSASWQVYVYYFLLEHVRVYNVYVCVCVDACGCVWMYVYVVCVCLSVCVCVVYGYREF
jgi:hypothetical protein